MQCAVFDSKFIADFLKSLEKRSKSIKYNTISSNIQKVIEKDDEQVIEKLEIEYVLFKQTTIRLFLWEDRWAWLDIRRSEKKEWLFEWQVEGRIGSSKPEEIVEAIRDSFFYAKNCQGEDLNKLWNKIILNSNFLTVHK